MVEVAEIFLELTGSEKRSISLPFADDNEDRAYRDLWVIDVRNGNEEKAIIHR